MLAALSTNLRNFISRNAFRREIITVIIVKLIAILALWYFFFSHPTSHDLNVGMLVDRFFAN